MIREIYLARKAYLIADIKTILLGYAFTNFKLIYL